MSLTTASRSERLLPLAGPAFAVLFLGGVVASSPPKNNASDAAWVANYTGHGHQFGHAATGLCLVFAGLCLATFLVGLWHRISDGQLSGLNPIPVVAAGVAAACMAAGGILMGAVSFTELSGAYPLPGADILRLGNNLGFGLAGVAGMLAAAIAVATLSVQAHNAGVFGSRMLVFGEIVAGLLVFSFLFVPIVALLVWAVAAAVAWWRVQVPADQSDARTGMRVAANL